MTWRVIYLMGSYVAFSAWVHFHTRDMVRKATKSLSDRVAALEAKDALTYRWPTVRVRDGATFKDCTIAVKPPALQAGEPGHEK